MAIGAPAAPRWPSDGRALSSRRVRNRYGFIEPLEGRQLLAADPVGGETRVGLRTVQTVFMDASLVGPAPIVLGRSLAADGSNSFVIRAVASGVVEKLVASDPDRWVDVSPMPTRSDPGMLLESLRLRTIRGGERLRWRPESGIAGRQRAFEILGWDPTGQSSQAGQTASPSVPPPPLDLTVAVNTGGVLEISREPPASDDATHYAVTVSGNGTATSVVTTARKTTWPGLDPTAWWHVSVTANNPQGSGPPAALTSQFPGISQRFELSVSATADIYAAGGNTVPVSPRGGGTLPPAIKLPAGTGRTLSFSGVDGSVSFNTDPAVPAVFRGQYHGPDGAAPERLDFSSTSSTVPGGRGFSELAPEIDQSFYIGDGLTGDGTGLRQTFRVPDAAIHLFFGFFDGSRFIHGPDFYGNNAGELAVSVTVVSPEAGLVSTPPVRQLPVGQWRSRRDGLVLEIVGDGSFAIIPPAGPRQPVSGRWTEAEGVAEFRNDNDAAVCPNVPGRYRWEQGFTGTLRFEKLAETCESRMAHMLDPFDPLAVA